MYMGVSPWSSQTISSDMVDVSKVLLMVSTVNAPTTSALSGQSDGFGSRVGEYMYENGTSSRVSSSPGSVPA